MFQIETALLDFDGRAATDSDKTSVVKGLEIRLRRCKKALTF